MIGAPGMKLGAHVELFKHDERTGKKVLVHTSRPLEVCGDCGQPVEGLVVGSINGTPRCGRCAGG